MPQQPSPPAAADPTSTRPEAYWSLAPAELLQTLASSGEGLSQREAAERLKRLGRNALDTQSQSVALQLFISQFKNPLVLVLVVASLVSMVAAEWVDAGVVLAIVLGSTVLGFAQEYLASNAIARLRAKITLNTRVLRDGQARTLPAARVVPGDVLLLSAGSLIPADGVLLEVKDLMVNQAVLTGETFPVEKRPGTVAAKATLAERSNCVFMGTSVASGTARVLVVQTGRQTLFGQIAGKLALRPPMT